MLHFFAQFGKTMHFQLSLILTKMFGPCQLKNLIWLEIFFMYVINSDRIKAFQLYY